jgi:hypothetical protein
MQELTGSYCISCTTVLKKCFVLLRKNYLLQNDLSYSNLMIIIIFIIQVIERYVSPQMARKYLKFDLDCFVETNKSIKWCPYPACQRAVNLPESERQMWEDSSLVPPVSHAVDCGGGHFFWY